MFETLGTTIYRHRWLTLVVSGLFLAIAVLVLVRGGPLTSGNIRGIESERAQRLVEQVQGHPVETTVVAVFQDRELAPSDPRFRAAMRAALEPIRADPRVLEVMAPEDVPPLLAARFESGPGRAALALITLRGDFKEAFQHYPAVRELLTSERLTITCTGHLSFMDDLGHVLEGDLIRAEVISLPLALLVLLFVFRSVVAAALPVGVGALAVVGGIAIVVALSHVTDIAQYTVNVCSLIGLGVAIDYSLFTVSRYREELAAGHDVPAALARAMARAGRVVAFSGLAVGTGLAGLFFFEGSYLYAMGVGGTIVVALAVIFALTFLPALLAVLGTRIDAGGTRFQAGRRRSGSHGWERLARAVMQRPVAVLVPTLVVLLVTALPVLHLRLAAADVRVLPASVEARRAFSLLEQHFPEQAATRYLIAVEFPGDPLTPERIGALWDLSRRVGDIPHVRKVESIVDLGGVPLSRAMVQQLLLSPPAAFADAIETAKRLSVGERVVLLQALTNKPPSSDEARRIVGAIRAQRAVGDGTLLVGGEAAGDVDATAYMRQRAPYAIAFVVGVTLVVLFLLLRSIVLPLKAVLMNVLSIGAAFGAVVWIFQDGHLFVSDGRPLEPSLPVLLFCVSFGLSMDYEVLMMSRMKEVFERTGDNTAAVAEGLARTAGLITSAAAIMIVVFVAFTLASVVLVQAVGFGTALAVALDATLVRILLVPSTMRLFGSLNWWLPRWFSPASLASPEKRS